MVSRLRVFGTDPTFRDCPMGFWESPKVLGLSQALGYLRLRNNPQWCWDSGSLGQSKSPGTVPGFWPLGLRDSLEQCQDVPKTQSLNTTPWGLFFNLRVPKVLDSHVTLGMSQKPVAVPILRFLTVAVGPSN